MLKKVGFNDNEEKLMKRKVDENQKSALKELEKVLGKDRVQPKLETRRLSSSELETQLSGIWIHYIAEIRENTEVNDVSEYQQDLNTSHTTQPDLLSKEWPKEQSGWPMAIIIAAMMLSMIGRFGPTLIENAIVPVPLEPEIIETIHTNQENLAQEKDSPIIDENRLVVEQFILHVREGTIEQSLSTIVSENYALIILENDQFMKQLGNAELEKVIQPHMGLPINDFLIAKAEEDFNAIVEVGIKSCITHIYAEDLNQSEKRKRNTKELMVRIELDGQDLL